MSILRLLDLALMPLIYRERWYKKQLCQNQIEGVIGNKIHFINVIKIQGRNFAPVRVSIRSEAISKNCIVLILGVGSQILGPTIHFSVLSIQKSPTTLLFLLTVWDLVPYISDIYLPLTFLFPILIFPALIHLFIFPWKL